MMSRIQKGMVAGFAGTVVVSLLEAANLMLGERFMSFPSIVAMIIGMDGNLLIGWIGHFLAGILVLGTLFGILCPRLPTDTAATKGILFAVGAFVGLMILLFAVGDYSTFSGSSGFGTLGWLLITNVVFGAAMGLVYGNLVEREKRAARAMGGGLPAH